MGTGRCNAWRHSPGRRLCQLWDFDMQDFGNHLRDRNVSPEENKHFQWLHLRSISPARAPACVQNFYFVFKSFPFILRMSKQKVWFSQKSTLHGLTEPFSTSYRNTLFLQSERKEATEQSYRRYVGKQKLYETTSLFLNKKASECPNLRKNHPGS